MAYIKYWTKDEHVFENLWLIYCRIYKTVCNVYLWLEFPNHIKSSKSNVSMFIKIFRDENLHRYVIHKIFYKYSVFGPTFKCSITKAWNIQNSFFNHFYYYYCKLNNSITKVWNIQNSLFSYFYYYYYYCKLNSNGTVIKKQTYDSVIQYMCIPYSILAVNEPSLWSILIFSIS